MSRLWDRFRGMRQGWEGLLEAQGLWKGLITTVNLCNNQWIYYYLFGGWQDQITILHIPFWHQCQRGQVGLQKSCWGLWLRFEGEVTRSGFGQWLQRWREVSSLGASGEVKWMGHDWMWRMRCWPHLLDCIIGVWLLQWDSAIGKRNLAEKNTKVVPLFMGIPV